MTPEQADSQSTASQRARQLAIALTVVLAVSIAGAILSHGATAARLLITLLAALPLIFGVWRLAARDRRAYAWMTLLVIPYLVLAVMEVIANPPARAWAGAAVFAAFAVFVVLIGYLRVTR